MLHNAISKLNERERLVIQQRKLTDTPLTLEDLSNKLGISKERVRQIENKAMEKLATALFKEKSRLFSQNFNQEVIMDTTATDVSKS